jgi:adenosylhomocysteine nucleosidase
MPTVDIRLIANSTAATLADSKLMENSIAATTTLLVVSKVTENFTAAATAASRVTENSIAVAIVVLKPMAIFGVKAIDMNYLPLFTLFVLSVGVAQAVEPKLPIKDHYIVVVGMASEASIAKDTNAVVVVGALRSDKLRADLNKLDISHVKGVISFGVAGGLNPQWAVGDLIVPSEINFQRRHFPTSKTLSDEIRAKVSASGVKPRDGVIAGVETMTDSNVEWRKKLRAETKGDAVDMESHIAAEFAERNGLPFTAVRVLSDAVGDTFPSAARTNLDAKGGVQGSLVFKELLKDPFQMGSLLKIGRNFNSATDVLKQVRPGLYRSRDHMSSAPVAGEWDAAEAEISPAE